MADEAATADTTKFATADKPLAPLASAKPAVDAGAAAGGDPAGAGKAPPAPVIDPPREVPAAARLRAFEDANMGPDAPRINGGVERGHGSLYSRLTDQQKAEHAGIEKLIGTEQKLAEAHAALIQAEADHEAALAAAEPAAASNG